MIYTYYVLFTLWGQAHPANANPSSAFAKVAPTERLKSISPLLVVSISVFPPFPPDIVDRQSSCTCSGAEMPANVQTPFRHSNGSQSALLEQRMYVRHNEFTQHEANVSSVSMQSLCELHVASIQIPCTQVSSVGQSVGLEHGSTEQPSSPSSQYTQKLLSQR